MKKVLIITYYWPPAGGAGVQRWLKFAKYIREFGWEPIIYTAENAEYPVIDESLGKDIPSNIEIIKGRIWEPYSYYKKLTGRKKKEKVYSGFINENKNESFFQKLSVFIRGNFFIPDARKFWITPSVKTLKKYLQNHKIDLILSNGPPHTTHIIGLKLKHHFDIPWVVDFRDPWTNIDFYDQLRLTSWADRMHKNLEKKVLDSADKIVTVSPSWAEDFEKLSGRKDVEVINNGYDHQDFIQTKKQLTEKISICHLGSMNKDRNVETLWSVLSEMITENTELRQKIEIRLIGHVDFSVLKSIEHYGLSDLLVKQDFVPHNEAVQLLTQMHILLLPINNTPNQAGVLPGKLYEYMGSGRPILSFSYRTDIDINDILRSTGAGKLFSHHPSDHEKNEIKNFILDPTTPDLKNVEKYSRQNLINKYVNEIFNSLVI